LERAALLCDGELLDTAHIDQALAADAIDSPTWVVPADSTGLPPSAPRRLQELEDAALLAAVQSHQGSRAELAAQLGISERSLYRKLTALKQKRAPQGPH
ncbi:MAG TPA: helix-turn-helix domain-containing protein, partial [Aquabacterium sp.]|nr:helix-turn-helix domain-containing protein [Aquabacterium sp.]